ncbi:hypothetical protein [Acinetobacter soli]|uniref:hypothetical protein n=1 Tax=Acinetobacter soli TaxID=487316 RepID=UPI002FF3A734
MILRLQQISENELQDHYHLNPSDKCYYFGEYTARASYGHSETNQLILNFKKPVDRRGLPEWYYKEKAIQEISFLLNQALAPVNTILFVPVPPSKAKHDPMYDDRMTRVLDKLNNGWMGNGYRELITQTTSTCAVHAANNRRNIEELINNYRVEKQLIFPIPSMIIVIDDVLTTGCHYKAMEHHLRQTYPSTEIVGLFLARRKIIDDIF